MGERAEGDGTRAAEHDPDLHGQGVGAQLLARTERVLDDLHLPFGFLTCRPEVVPFYAAGGWLLVDGQVTRMIDNSHLPEVYRGPAMILPVAADVDDWPHEPVDRNGLEV